MENTLLIALLALLVGAGIGFLLGKLISARRFDYLKIEAEAKARAIEQEAEQLLKDAEGQRRTRELEQEKAFNERLAEVEQRNRNLILRERELEEERDRLH